MKRTSLRIRCTIEIILLDHFRFTGNANIEGLNAREASDKS